MQKIISRCFLRLESRLSSDKLTILSAHTIKKVVIQLSVIMPIMVPCIVATTFTAAEARRAYQTVDQQDFSDETDTPEAGRNINETAIDTTPIPTAKHQGQIKQDRFEKPLHQNASKAAPARQQATSGPVLTSPLDLMMQFENQRQIDLENRSGISGKPSSIRALNASKNTDAVKKKPATHDKASDVAAPLQEPKKSSSGSPIELAITALAVGVCLYSLSRKLLFKQNLKDLKSQASTPT